MIGDFIVHRHAGTTGEVLDTKLDTSPFSGFLGQTWLYVRFEDGFECWCLASSTWTI